MALSCTTPSEVTNETVMSEKLGLSPITLQIKIVKQQSPHDSLRCFNTASTSRKTIRLGEHSEH